jgi:hypothetical protein
MPSNTCFSFFSFAYDHFIPVAQTHFLTTVFPDTITAQMIVHTPQLIPTKGASQTIGGQIAKATANLRLSHRESVGMHGVIDPEIPCSDVKYEKHQSEYQGESLEWDYTQGK